MNAIPTNIVAINSMESLKHELRTRKSHHDSRIKQGRQQLAFIPPFFFRKRKAILDNIKWNEGGASECSRLYSRIVEMERGNG